MPTKSLFALLIFSGILLFGCKKNNNAQQINTSKIYLISTIVYTNQAFGTSTSDQYTYDSQNRVIELKTNHFLTYDYKYTYDINNNLTTVQTYDQNGNLKTTDTYAYSGTKISVVTQDADDNGGGGYSFSLNSQGQVTSSTLEGTTQYVYDSAGNITSYNSCCDLATSDTYTYDNEKHPLSMIGATNFHLKFIASNGGFPTSFINNIVRDAGLAGGTNYAYVYNNAGFPVSAVSGGTSITYTYITK